MRETSREKPDEPTPVAPFDTSVFFAPGAPPVVTLPPDSRVLVVQERGDTPALLAVRQVELALHDLSPVDRARVIAWVMSGERAAMRDAAMPGAAG